MKNSNQFFEHFSCYIVKIKLKNNRNIEEVVDNMYQFICKCIDCFPMLN